MRPRIQPPAERLQAPVLQNGLHPPRLRFSPRVHFPHPLSLSWPLGLRLRGHPPGRARLGDPAQTEEAWPSSVAGRPDLSVVLLIIGAAVGFVLFLLVAGGMPQLLFSRW